MHGSVSTLQQEIRSLKGKLLEANGATVLYAVMNRKHSETVAYC
jgi:hypothetical protein